MTTRLTTTPDTDDGTGPEPEDGADPSTVMATHDAAHAALDTLFYAALESLTALDVSGARAAWGALALAVSAHARAEEAFFGDALDDAFEPPRGASARIFVPEHRTLERLLEAGDAVLARLAAQGEGMPLRARVVRALEPLLRVQHLLSHHYARERDILYPWVLPRLPATSRRGLCEALGGAVRAR
jgi:hypothetical protein